MEPTEVLKKYPRLTAHLICESLGYFTPKSAAIAIRMFKEKQPYFCEWYSSISAKRTGDLFNKEETVKIGELILKQAIANRKFHKGYMADYNLARRLIQAELNGHGPEFASWF